MQKYILPQKEILIRLRNWMKKE